jgi:hypothetical protein
MGSQGDKKNSRDRHITFQELKDIVGSKDKTRADKRKAFVDYFGKPKKKENGHV